MKSEIMNLFATPVVRYSIDRDFFLSEMKFLSGELEQPTKAITNSSSSNKNILISPEMREIREFAEQSLAHYFKTIFNTSNKVRLKITQSWLTLTREGESHHSHTYPNSVVSGVLYINLGSKDGINFFRNEDSIWYELLREQETYHNTFKYFIPASVGDLILFPSNIRHGVPEVKEPIERVSLSFNSFFEGELGRSEYSNSLTLELK